MKVKTVENLIKYSVQGNKPMTHIFLIISLYLYLYVDFTSSQDQGRLWRYAKCWYETLLSGNYLEKGTHASVGSMGEKSIERAA
jgi:hypothetical protein